MTTTTAASSSSNSQILANYIASQSSTTTGTTTSSGASTSISSVTGDFNTFLKILTTQLQNQDPMSATDPNQFTQELVQFSGIEQQINGNKKLDQILSAISAGGISPYLNYVGKYVEASSTSGKIALQNGTAGLSYSLAEQAASAVVTIKDSSGKSVASFSGSVEAGANRMVWNGKDADGNQLADGTYSVTVTAKSSSGEDVKVTDQRIIGQITGVQTDSSGTATVMIGGVSVSNDSIYGVYNSLGSTSES